MRYAADLLREPHCQYRSKIGARWATWRYTNILIRYDYSAHKNNFGIQIFAFTLTLATFLVLISTRQPSTMSFSFLTWEENFPKHILRCPSPSCAHFTPLYTHKSNNIPCFPFAFSALPPSKKEKFTIYDKDEEEIARKQKALCGSQDESTKAFMFLNHLMNGGGMRWKTRRKIFTRKNFSYFGG